MDKMHHVSSIRAGITYFYLTVDGQSYRIRWADCSPRLAKATMSQRKRLEVSPSGYGLHWLEIDEDLAITPLLQRAERVVARGRVTTGQPIDSCGTCRATRPVNVLALAFACM